MNGRDLGKRQTVIWTYNTMLIKGLSEVEPLSEQMQRRVTSLTRLWCRSVQPVNIAAIFLMGNTIGIS